MQDSEKQSDVKYILTLSEEQAHIIEIACELYARLLIGQFREITFRIIDLRKENYSERRDIANELLETCAKVIFGRNLYNQPDVTQTKEHHLAFDIYQVLRYERIKHDYPEENETYNSPPFSVIGAPFAKCVIIDGKGGETNGKLQVQEKAHRKSKERSQNR